MLGFSGDTLVRPIGNGLKTLEELFESKESFWINSMTSDKEPAVSWAKRVFRSLEPKELVFLLLNNGTYVKCSHDQTILAWGEENFVQVNNLRQDQMLRSFDRSDIKVVKVLATTAKEFVYTIVSVGLNDNFALSTGIYAQAYNDVSVQSLKEP